MSTTNGTLVTVPDVFHEVAVNIVLLQEQIDDLHPKLTAALQNNRLHSIKAAERSNTSKFTADDVVLVALEQFLDG